MKFKRSRVLLSHDRRYDFATIENSILWDTTRTIGRLNPVHRPRKLGDSTARDIRFENIIVDDKWMFDVGNHFISTGLQYRHQQLKDTLIEAPLNKKQWQWALFAEDERMIKDNLIATFGLHYDRNQYVSSHFNPRAYLVWDINERWNMWVQGEHRAKKYNDLNWEKQKVYYRLYSIMNLGGGYKATENLIFNAGVYNIFNKNFADYQLPKVGSKVPSFDANYENRYNKIREGRRLWASMKYTF